MQMITYDAISSIARTIMYNNYKHLFSGYSVCGAVWGKA